LPEVQTEKTILTLEEARQTFHLLGHNRKDRVKERQTNINSIQIEKMNSFKVNF